MNAALSVILVSYNEREYLRRVLQLLEQEFSRDQAEVIVVDNDSKDDSVTMVRQEFPWAQVIETHANLMYGKGNNVGLAAAHGQWLMVLNPDVSWTPGALRKFFERAKSMPNLGAAGPQVRYRDGRIQVTSHKHFPSWLTVLTEYCLPLQQVLLRTAGHPYLQSLAQHEVTHQTATMTGVCLLAPRSAYEKVGGFDPKFTMFLEETEWQKRMDNCGLDRWFIADSPIVHYGSAQKSFSQASQHFLWGLEYYTRRHWGGPLRGVRLLTAIWLGTLISLVFLIVAWPITFVVRTGHRRVTHYLKQYMRLVGNLFRFPTQPPNS